MTNDLNVVLAAVLTLIAFLCILTWFSADMMRDIGMYLYARSKAVKASRDVYRRVHALVMATQKDGERLARQADAEDGI